jgi:hypothetical protein
LIRERSLVAKLGTSLSSKIATISLFIERLFDFATSAMRSRKPSGSLRTNWSWVREGGSAISEE